MTEREKTKVNSFIKQFIILSCAVALITVLMGYSIFVITAETDADTSASVTKKRCVVVIDPGHGGEDGGAVATDGTAEKELNLEFARTLHMFCEVFGIDSVMTRETDELLYNRYSELDDYTGKKKVYDLKNRLRFTNEMGDGGIFVGIHMNKFTDPRYSGTQVYYSPNSDTSQRLADIIQSNVKKTLQPDNDRAIKKAGSAIFLLNRLQVPAVLIECGFLSNETETVLLKSSEYKKEFSLTTAVAIGEFIKSDEG